MKWIGVPLPYIRDDEIDTVLDIVTFLQRNLSSETLRKLFNSSTGEIARQSLYALYFNVMDEHEKEYSMTLIAKDLVMMAAVPMEVVAPFFFRPEVRFSDIGQDFLFHLVLASIDDCTRQEYEILFRIMHHIGDPPSRHPQYSLNNRNDPIFPRKKMGEPIGTMSSMMIVEPSSRVSSFLYTYDQMEIARCIYMVMALLTTRDAVRHTNSRHVCYQMHIHYLQTIAMDMEGKQLQKTLLEIDPTLILMLWIIIDDKAMLVDEEIAERIMGISLSIHDGSVSTRRRAFLASRVEVMDKKLDTTDYLIRNLVALIYVNYELANIRAPQTLSRVFGRLNREDTNYNVTLGAYWDILSISNAFGRRYSSGNFPPFHELISNDDDLSGYLHNFGHSRRKEFDPEMLNIFSKDVVLRSRYESLTDLPWPTY